MASSAAIRSGEIEFDAEFFGYHLGEERAAGHWAADGLNAVCREAAGQLIGDRPQYGRTGEERVQIEPRVAVMAGLILKMPASNREQAEQ